MEDRKRAAAAMPAASIASFDRRRPAEQQAHLLGHYWAESRRRLQSSVATVTVDGSRVGQESTLVLAAWSPKDQVSVWLPPQVGALVVAALGFNLSPASGRFPTPEAQGSSGAVDTVGPCQVLWSFGGGLLSQGTRSRVKTLSKLACAASDFVRLASETE